MDYDVHRPSRQCAHCDRVLAEGEIIYSALVSQGAELLRQDYCLPCWSNPPENCLGWWKAETPRQDAKKPHQTPTEALLELLALLADRPEQADMRFVLALLLVRRRVLRLEQTERQADGEELLTLYCPRDESLHTVPGRWPTAERAAQIEAQLNEILFAPAA